MRAIHQTTASYIKQSELQPLTNHSDDFILHHHVFMLLLINQITLMTHQIPYSVKNQKVDVKKTKTINFSSIVVTEMLFDLNLYSFNLTRLGQFSGYHLARRRLGVCFLRFSCLNSPANKNSWATVRMVQSTLCKCQTNYSSA